MFRKLNFMLSFILALILVSGLTAQVDPGTEMLMHHWAFDDGTASDPVGGADGTLVGGAAVADGVLNLSTVGDYMEMSGETIALLIYDEMTMVGWFSAVPDANQGFHMLAYFGDSVNGLGSNGLFYSPERGDDVSRIAISCGNIDQPWTVESGANGPEIQDGMLHHFAGIFSQDEVVYYLDGVLQEAVPMDPHNSLYSISTNYAYLGRGGYDADPSWLGQIDDFRIYSKALTEDEVLFLFATDPSDVEESKTAPETYALAQNYPNPFNPTTEIRYTTARAGHVSLNVFNVRGENVAKLVDDVMTAGEHRAVFNAGDLANGVYYYQLETSEGVLSKRMVLMK
ncbi:T9SS type A sorting domain-containing protein [bacterium]|nr:T9SS type A sorting domain-containing protein [bacterium]